MTIKYVVVPNNLQAGKYYLRVVQGNRVELDTLIKEIVADTSLSESDVRAVVNALARRVQNHLLLGNRPIIDGLASFSLSLRESLLSADAIPTSNARLMVNIRPDVVLQKEISHQAQLEQAFSRVRIPSLTAFFDAQTKREGVYTAANMGRLRGDSLMFNQEATDEGVFFMADDDIETAVNTYLDIGSREITFLIPASLSGTQSVEVRTRYSGSTLRIGRLAKPIMPA